MNNHSNQREIIADELCKAGWSWGCVSAVTSEGQEIWIVDAHRDDGRRFIARSDESANIWVAIHDDGAVKKLRASDGMLLSIFGVGSEPHGVLFDGTSIWVAALGDDYLVKLDPSDGSPLGRARVGRQPYALAFDGTRVWVTNSFVLDNTMSAVRAYNGLVHTVPVGSYPQGIAFDGRQIWVADKNDNSVSILSARDGAHLRTVHVERQPTGVCFDGRSIWGRELREQYRL